MVDIDAHGVYCIRNTKTGKVYVGSASRLTMRQRWMSHRSKLRSGKHSNRLLQASWNKHGEKALQFDVLCPCHPDECLAQEQRLMDTLRAFGKCGYNLAPKAGNTSGVKYSDDVRRKASEAIKAAHQRPEVKALRKAVMSSPESKRRRSEAARQVASRPGYRQKMSQSVKRAQSDPEVRERIRVAHQLAVSNPEYRSLQAKLSAGRKHTAETIAKIKASNTPEVRRKKGEANKNKRMSEETRKKLSEAHKKLHAENPNLKRDAVIKGWEKRRSRHLDGANL